MFVPEWLVVLIACGTAVAICFVWKAGRRKSSSRWPEGRPNTRQTNDEQEQAHRDFVANVSHELRTPVSIIKGFSETLIDDYENLSEKQRRKFLSKIQRNSERLNSLIEDLLSLARLEALDVTLDRKNLDLSELIGQIGEDFQTKLGDGGPAISVDLPDSPLMISGDAEKLISVFENLIENAIVHAENLSTIKVQAKMDADGQHVACRIEDDGQGIPEKELERLFERFYRLEKSRSRERGGTGLGLSIVREVIEAHQGEVVAQSRLGKGSVFSFRFPAST